MAHHHHHYFIHHYSQLIQTPTFIQGFYQMPKYDPAQLLKMLTYEEGSRDELYTDSRGNRTIGIGHNMSMRQRPETIAALYNIDVTGCEVSLDLNWPWWRNLDPVRQLVMMDMIFNMGSGALATFHDFLAAMRVGDYISAAKDMMESKWEAQVGHRAVILQGIVLTGQVPLNYPPK